MKYKKIIKNFLFLFFSICTNCLHTEQSAFEKISLIAAGSLATKIAEKMIEISFNSASMQERKHQDEAQRLYFKEMKPHTGKLFYDKETIKVASNLKNYLQSALKDNLSFPAVLLYGPPGTGKTALAGNIITLLYQKAGKSNVSICNISAADLLRNQDGIDHFVVLIKQIKKARKKGQIAVLWIDECELVLKNRHGSDVSSMQPKILTTFLSEIPTGYNDFLIIASTNIPEQIDDAAFRRFGTIIPVLNPNPQTAEKICLYFIEENKRKVIVDKFSLKVTVDPRIDFSPDIKVFECSSIEKFIDQESLEIASLCAAYNRLVVIIMFDNISPADLENTQNSLFNVARVNSPFIGLAQMQAAITKKSLQKTEIMNSRFSGTKNLILEKKALIADEQTKNDLFALTGWDNLCVLNKNKDPETFLNDLFLEILHCEKEDLEDLTTIGGVFCPFGESKVEEIIKKRKFLDEINEIESKIENIGALFEDSESTKFFMRESIQKAQKQNTKKNIEFVKESVLKSILLKPIVKPSEIDLSQVKKEEKGMDPIYN